MKGKLCYLYRSIDSDGYTLDFQLQKTRNHQAGYMFIKRSVNTFGDPKTKHRLCFVHFKNYQTMLCQIFGISKYPSCFTYNKRNRNNACYIQTKEKSHSRLLFFDIQRITAIIQNFLNDNHSV
ncbi:TPA: DDE-type integrase/transposase/recombinase [Bacillus cereus]